MATTYNDKAGRQKILEGLWLIGIEPAQLNVSADLAGPAFLDALHRNGVHDEFIGRAIRGVDWRATSEDSQAPLYQKVASLLRASGYRQDEIDRFYKDAARDGNNPRFVMDILTRDFNDRSAGAMIHKATGGKAPDGAVWNPFRTDTPPNNVDMRYGGAGVLATNLPPGYSATEPPNPTAFRGETVRPNQTTGVPTPPAGIGRALPATPGAPNLAGKTGAPGGPGGPGGPGAPGNMGPGIPPPKPLTPAERKEQLEGTYGWAATFMNDPEVAVIIHDVMSGTISDAEADRRWRNTGFYKRTTAAERTWAIFEKSDPADAAGQLQDQADTITSRARGLGFAITPARAMQIATVSKKHGWSDQEINAALASEVKYDPTGAKTGVLAQIKKARNDQLVPLSDQAMTQWAQAIVGGTRTLQDFEAYLKDQAKSLFPTIGTSLDTMSVKQYLSPYEETIKNTLGQTEIDWTDPKWFRFVNTVNDKGERGVMSIADMQRTIITDGQYGYDKTEKGKQAKGGLARSILEDFGFLTSSERSAF